ncbi:MAG: adenylate/guanylate cyclase domain-containing protein [Nitrosopumilus sp.]|nr:adenylate/guanylate cyclase domain-containing protein [Nitrosopumilus sp.]
MQSSSGKEDISSGIIDMLLGKTENKTVDSETLIKNVQKRIRDSIKEGYKYSRIADASEEFLRKHVFEQVEMAIIYVDLVGSTKLSLKLPPEKLSVVISSFVQEMSYVIIQCGGFVLKFSGDAVIGYFVGKGSSLQAADDAVGCAESMLRVVKEGINKILSDVDSQLPELAIKIGIDFGVNTVVQYGSDEKNSLVDLLGVSMNMAAKIQSIAQPNQIVVGKDVFDRFHPSVQEMFVDVTDSLKDWAYTSKNSNVIYRVYEYKNRD